MSDLSFDARRYKIFESTLSNELKDHIRDVEDYPKPGIVFKDITPVLANPDLIRRIVEEQAAYWRSMGIEAVVGVEARGFILGSVLAHVLKCPFIPVRKSGKLPSKRLAQQYNLEYGSAEIEIHEDALPIGCKTLIHDDLLATGGTSLGAAKLVERLGGEVAGFSFLIKLSFLVGADKIAAAYDVPLVYQVSY